MQLNFSVNSQIKRVIVLCSIMMIAHFYSLAQFSFRVFPMGLGGSGYDDTILNTRAVLQKAGIKQVSAYKTHPEITKTFAAKTMMINKNGCINKVTMCFAKNDSTNFTFCITDTIIYDLRGRITDVIITDNHPNKYPQWHREYNGENEANGSYVESSLQDSVRTYYSYNNQGQLVNLRRIGNEREFENTSFYYNADGLPDSTRTTAWGTFIFKRRIKRQYKIIEMTNSVASYKWVYNLTGQCISNMYILKELHGQIRKPGYKGNLKIEFDYYYNPNGTLSKVVATSFDKPDYTIYYSYL